MLAKLNTGDTPIKLFVSLNFDFIKDFMPDAILLITKYTVIPRYPRPSYLRLVILPIGISFLPWLFAEFKLNC